MKISHTTYEYSKKEGHWKDDFHRRQWHGVEKPPWTHSTNSQRVILCILFLAFCHSRQWHRTLAWHRSGNNSHQIDSMIFQNSVEAERRIARRNDFAQLAGIGALMRVLWHDNIQYSIIIILIWVNFFTLSWWTFCQMAAEGNTFEYILYFRYFQLFHTRMIRFEKYAMTIQLVFSALKNPNPPFHIQPEYCACIKKCRKSLTELVFLPCIYWFCCGGITFRCGCPPCK